jgi:hypothetical protein
MAGAVVVEQARLVEQAVDTPAVMVATEQQTLLLALR